MPLPWLPCMGCVGVVGMCCNISIHCALQYGLSPLLGVIGSWKRSHALYLHGLPSKPPTALVGGWPQLCPTGPIQGPSNEAHLLDTA